MTSKCLEFSYVSTRTMRAMLHNVHMEHGWKKDTAINGIEIKIRCISARKKQAESKIRNVNRARASFLQKR